MTLKSYLHFSDFDTIKHKRKEIIIKYKAHKTHIWVLTHLKNIKMLDFSSETKNHF